MMRRSLNVDLQPPSPPIIPLLRNRVWIYSFRCCSSMKRPLELWSWVQSTVTDSRDDTPSFPELPRTKPAPSSLWAHTESDYGRGVRSGRVDQRVNDCRVCCCFLCYGDCIWLLLCKEGQPVIAGSCRFCCFSVCGMRYSVDSVYYGVRYSVCFVFGFRCAVFGVQFQCQCQKRLWSHVESSSTQWNLKFAASV